MSSFFSFSPADSWQRLLCDAMWQSTLIAGLGWLAARFLMRQSAARAWFMLMTLIACAIVPLASMAARAKGWTVLVADSDRIPFSLSDSVTITSADVEQFVQELSSGPIEPDPSAAADLKATVDRPIDELNADNISPAAVQSSAAKSAVVVVLPVAAGQAAVRFTSAIVLQILGTIWLALSVLLLARLLLAIAAARRTMRNATPCSDTTLLSAAAEAARRIGVPCPGVFYSRHVETPTILAFRRSRLLVPPVEASLRDANTVALSTAAIATPDAAGSISRLGETRPPIDWIAAFSHELAHVARGDGWSRLAVECIRIVLPLQPLIWLLRRSFHTACEESCDDWAVATGSNPIDLADTLTAWINRPKRTVSLIAIGMSSTRVRTVRLLQMRKSPEAHLSWSCRWIGIPCIALLIAGLAIAQSPSRENKPKGQDGGDNSSSPRSNIDPASNAPSRGDGSSATDQVEKSIAADSLIALYERRLAQDQSELDQLTKEPNPNLSPDYPNLLREQIDDLKKRLEKRKSERLPLVLQELQDAKANSQRRQIGTMNGTRAGATPYIIQPQDTLLIEPVQLVPKKPVRVEPFDQVKIVADPTTTKLENPISGTFQVDSSGEVVLGPAYGAVKISGLTRREAEEAVTIQLQATLKDPAVSLAIDESRLENGIKGEHVVSADGSISLGAYGSVEVEGLTITQAREAIEKQLSDFFAAPKISVQVKSGSSKVYYVFSWNSDGGKGNVERIPITGNDTVLDAISHLKAGIEFTGAKLFIQRLIGGGKTEIIEVDLDRVLEGTELNRQLLPGDRIFVSHRPPTAPAVPPTAAGKAAPRSMERKDAEKLNYLLPSDDPPKAWAENNPASLPPYEIEPPDILLISNVGLVPKEPFQIQPLDVLQVDADPTTTKLGNPIRGRHVVEPGGMLNLGAAYGKVKVGRLLLEEAQSAVLKQLQKMLKDPKVSVMLGESGGVQQVSGRHLVGPDGTINLGTYGQVYVTGLTIPQTKQAIEKKLDEFFEAPKVSVDIYANNSKVYYVITKGAGYGDNIQRFSVTGNETVLDAVAQIHGLTPTSGAKIWIERSKSRYSSGEKTLEVKWDEITQGRGNAKCQILPGDRVFIDRSDVIGKDPSTAEAPEPLPNTTNF